MLQTNTQMEIGNYYIKHYTMYNVEIEKVQRIKLNFLPM